MTNSPKAMTKAYILNDKKHRKTIGMSLRTFYMQLGFIMNGSEKRC